MRQGMRDLLGDMQGSTRLLATSSGTIAASYQYDAFGNLQHGPATPATSYLYSGQQFDALTGLYYLRARYYQPDAGRFLSRDTHPVDFQDPVELNRYTYVANDPVNLLDPSGLMLVEQGVQLQSEKKTRKLHVHQKGVQHPRFLRFKKLGKQYASEARLATNRLRDGIRADPNLRTMESALMQRTTVAVSRVQGKPVMAVNHSDKAVIRLLQQQNPGYKVIHPGHKVFKSLKLRVGARHSEQLLMKYGQIRNGTSNYSIVSNDLKAIGVGNTIIGPCRRYCRPFFDNVVGGSIPLYWVGHLGRSLVPLIVTGFGIAGIKERDVRVY